MNVDYSLYLVTDEALSGPRGVVETVLEAVAGGVSVVQLRDKKKDGGRIAEHFRDLRQPLRARGVPLLINDHLDLAVELGADGVHLGQSDAQVEEARSRLGADALIGMSITEGSQVPRLERLVEAGTVDYVGLGPVFPTETKPDMAPALGLDEFRAVCARLSLPVVAIGGINVENTAPLVRAGADGVAVVSAICSAFDVRRSAKRLRWAVESARVASTPSEAPRPRA